MRSARWRASGSTPPTAPWTPSPPPTWWRAPAASKAATWSSAAMTSRSGAAPPTPASTRSRSMPNAWPMSCGCRWCGWSTAPAAAARSSPTRRSAGPTCRPTRAGTWSSTTWARCRWSPPAWAPWPGWARPAWSPPISRSWSASWRSCSWPGRPWLRPAWAGRSPRRSSAAGRSTPASRGPWTTWPRPRRRRWTCAGAFSGTCRPMCGSCPLSAPSRARWRPWRSCARSCPAPGASPTTCAASSAWFSTRARFSRSPPATAAPASPRWRVWAAARWRSWPPIPRSTAAGSRRLRPTRWRAGWTRPTPSICRS